MQLASRFASRSPSLRSDYPLSDDQIRRVAPSIFADAPHESRSERYAYIPTAAVLAELRKEGFQPFMVCQTRVRDEGKREHTKHMLRLRHSSQINGAEANEIVLLNSHDGTSSYQMLAGMFRFVCSNGLVCGDTVADVNLAGCPGDKGQHGFGRGHVGILGQRGMFDAPDAIEAHLLGILRLIDDLVEHRRFVGAAGIDHLGFIDDREFHRHALPQSGCSRFGGRLTRVTGVRIAQLGYFSPPACGRGRGWVSDIAAIK